MRHFISKVIIKTDEEGAVHWEQYETTAESAEAAEASISDMLTAKGIEGFTFEITMDITEAVNNDPELV
jgi:hypothetical protein